jgi:murein DD-endopeptidase MepM/ murein hydrolase activator NlpD
MTLRERIATGLTNIFTLFKKLQGHNQTVAEPNLLDPMGTEGVPQKRPLLERLKDTYRLTIMNPETFEEIGNYKLSLLSVYTAVSSMVILLTILVVSLIVFTPLKNYIPGYGDVGLRNDISTLKGKVEDLEETISENQTYIDYTKKFMTDDVETVKEAPKEDVGKIPDSLLDVGTIEEEKQLRDAFEKNKGVVSLVTTNPNSNNRESGVNLSAKEVALEQMYFTVPIAGEVIRSVKMNEQHYGVDVIAPKNTPIKAALDGYVVASDFTVETGNTIALQHANGVVTSYKHCSSLLKKQGSFVQAGEAIAIIGNTGTLSNGPHLHFELWHNGKCKNPTDYISFK